MSNEVIDKLVHKDGPPETKMPELSYASYQPYICDVLGAMRKAIKHLNINLIPGYIEEAQHMATRMENALGVNKDIPKLEEDMCKLKDARQELKKEVQALIDQRDQLKKDQA